MASSPVEYVSAASEQLRRDWWEITRSATKDNNTSSYTRNVYVHVGCAKTRFYIDLEESREMLKDLSDWPFRRQLPDGHEFIVLLGFELIPMTVVFHNMVKFKKWQNINV